MIVNTLGIKLKQIRIRCVSSHVGYLVYYSKLGVGTEVPIYYHFVRLHLRGITRTMRDISLVAVTLKYSA